MQRGQYYFAGAALLVLAAVAAAYVPGLHGPFVFDDLTNILQAPGIRMTDLSFGSLAQAWDAREFDALKRPLAMLSFAGNYYFTQFDVFYFKTTNLIVHLAVGSALFALTLILLRRHTLTSSCPYAERHLKWLALAVAGIWLLHPFNLTSVLYVVQRMNSLSALFTVLGLIGYCHGREQILQGNRFGFLTLLSSLLLFGGLATLSKENGVLLLPLAALVELAFYRFAAHPALATLFRRFWLVVIALPLVLALAVLLIDYERWFGAAAYRFRDFTVEERLLTQARVLWLYLRLIFLPDVATMGLYHDDLPMSRGLLEPLSTLFAALGILGLIAIGLAARKRAPVLFFGILWFFVGHSMESSVLALELVHEHRNYLPQYGLLFAAIYFVAAPWSAITVARTLRLRLGFLALVVALFGSGTYARSSQWQDELTLYTLEVMNHPESARSHTMLGAWMHTHGLHQDAKRHLTIAANLAPHKAEHLIRLVQIVYAAEGHVSRELIEELRYRLEYGRPSAVTLWVYQPLLRVTRDNPEVHDQVLDIYAAIVARPDVRFTDKQYEAAYHILAKEHTHRGRAKEALHYLGRARTLNPRPRYDLASAQLYVKSGCSDKARHMLAELQGRDLGSDDEAQLREVQSLLVDQNISRSRCTL